MICKRFVLTSLLYIGGIVTTGMLGIYLYDSVMIVPTTCLFLHTGIYSAYIPNSVSRR